MSQEQCPTPVRVALRIRPVLLDDSESKTRIHVIPNTSQIIIGKDKRAFTFDRVFCPETNQQTVYETEVEPLLAQFLEGFNVTIFAYGQTFSGKTYTMGSDNTHETKAEARGCIPRAVEYIFKNIGKQSNDKIFYTMSVSFVEIYQEQIRDLLMPGVESRDISIREKQGTITIAGVHEAPVLSEADMLKCLEIGGHARSTGDTQVHSYSSRSHAIFTITLEQRSYKSPSQLDLFQQESLKESTVLKRSKLHLVDLAGSERLKRTGAEGVRLKESVKINSGLLALGNVISILGQDTKSSTSDRHVPYRDSKLTRLLQDSLGGNSKTLMLACVSPLEEDVDESLNTLKYANRARKIQNKAVLNIVDQQAAEFCVLQTRIDELQTQLNDKESQPPLASSIPVPTNFDDPQFMISLMEELKQRTIKGSNAIKDVEILSQERQELVNELQESQSQLQLLQDQNKEFQSEIHVKTEESLEFKSKFEKIQKDFKFVLDCSCKWVLGESLESNKHQSLVELMEEHVPEANIQSLLASKEELLLEQEKRQEQAPSQVGTEEPEEPKTKITPRFFRRKVKKVEEEESLVDKLKKQVKSLEDELFEAHERLSVFQNTMKKDSESIVSIKVVNEVAMQTEDDSTLVKESLANMVPPPPPLVVEDGSRYATSLADESAAASEEEFPLRRGEGTKTSVSLMDLEKYQNQSMEDLVHDLNTAIKAKVDLLKDLSKAARETEKMRHAFTDKIQKLEREIESLQIQSSKLVEESKEKEIAKEKLREEYERKIKLYETQLSKLKAKQKDHEKLSKDKEHADRKTLEMQAEVEKVSSQFHSFKRKLKEDSDKFTELEGRKSKELAALNKQYEDSLKKIRQLENANENMRKKLDRRMEEMKKWKENPGVLSNKVSSSTPKKSTLQLHQQIQVEHSQVEHSIENEESLLADPLLLSEEETKSILNSIQNIDSELFNSTRLMEDLEKNITYLEDKSLDKSTDKSINHLNELKKKRAYLLYKMVDLGQKKKTLQGQLHPHKENVIDEKDDIEYESVMKEFEQDVDILGLVPTLKCASIKQVKDLILLNLRETLHLKSLYKDKCTDYQNLIQSKSEQEESSQRLSLKLQKAIRTYEKKMNGVESSKTRLAMKESEIQTENDFESLEKDLFYYRQTNKDLKTKLRELVAKNHKLSAALGSHGNNVPVAV